MAADPPIAFLRGHAMRHPAAEAIATGQRQAAPVTLPPTLPARRWRAPLAPGRQPRGPRSVSCVKCFPVSPPRQQVFATAVTVLALRSGHDGKQDSSGSDARVTHTWQVLAENLGHLTSASG